MQAIVVSSDAFLFTLCVMTKNIFERISISLKSKDNFMLSDQSSISSHTLLPQLEYVAARFLSKNHSVR